MAILGMVVFLFMVFPIYSHAEETVTLDISTGNILITETGYSISKDWDIDEGEEIAFKGNYVLTGTSNIYGVSVIKGKHNITISNLSICPASMYFSPIYIYDADVELSFEGNNKLADNTSNAALELDGKSNLVLNGKDKGKLELYSENGTGIGSNSGGICGDITINSGEINIIASTAGIGNDAGAGTCGDITINGGKITIQATDGVGIGNGSYRREWDWESENGGSCGDILINSGDITIESYYTGIGNAAYRGACGDITINGGNISVNANKGIGDSAGKCGNIVINSGNIETTGIGTIGFTGHCGDILITGGNVRSVAFYCAIGADSNGVCGDITISGGNVEAVATGHPEDPRLIGIAIGAYIRGECGMITLNKDVVKTEVPKDNIAIGAFIDEEGSSMNGSCQGIKIIGNDEAEDEKDEQKEETPNKPEEDKDPVADEDETVTEDSRGEGSPKTGDSQGIMLWSLLLIMSFITMIKLSAWEKQTCGNQFLK